MKSPSFDIHFISLNLLKCLKMISIFNFLIIAVYPIYYFYFITTFLFQYFFKCLEQIEIYVQYEIYVQSVYVVRAKPQLITNVYHRVL